MLFLIKIIPPECWNPIIPNFDFEKDESKTFPVVFQDVMKCNSDPKKLYIWNSSKLKTKHMTLRQYVEEARKLESKFANLSLDEKEKKILTGCIKNPMYGTDIEFNVLNEHYDCFNLHRFPNLLDKYAEKFGHVGGVTTHLSYVGSFGSRFSWHVEDMNLGAIILMLFGMPKILYLIPPHDGPKLEALQKKHQKWPSTNCTHPLRHKSNCFDPNFVRSQGIEVFKVNRNNFYFQFLLQFLFNILQSTSINFNQIIHNPKEIVILAPSAYHSGMNVGLNFAASVNYAFEDWVEEGRKFETCQCLK